MATRLMRVLLVLLAGCQTYQFEPVKPVIIVVEPIEIELQAVLTPNVMMAVDRSGSMAATTSMEPSCRGCTTGTCPAACPTRMRDLQESVSTFTSLAQERLRLGLTVFPQETVEPGAGAACRAPTSVQVPLPPAARVDDAAARATNRTSAMQVNLAVQRLTPGGGTPTGATLAFLSREPGLTNQTDFRPDYVLLLTDGLPNCNESNPNDFVTDAAVCRCQSGTGDCSGALRRRGCLDADGTVAQVEALSNLGVKTIVVGFGADTGQVDAREVLGRLATAGRFGPAFQASNRAELEEVLRRILIEVTPVPCQYELPSQPISNGSVSLQVNGAPVAQGDSTWRVSGRSLTLDPVFCEANLGSKLSVRIASSP